MPDLRSKQEETIITFIKSSEFKEIIEKCIKNETVKLEEKNSKLENEVIQLKESNIELIRLLTSDEYKNMGKTCPEETKNDGIVNGTTTTTKKTFKEAVTENKLAGNRQQNPNNKIEETRVEKRNLRSRVNKESSPRNNPLNEHNRNINENNTVLNEEKKENEGIWKFPKHKYKRRNNVIYGKGNDNNTFKGVVRYVDFHVFRCPLDLSTTDIVTYLKSKNIPDIKCETMKSRYPELYTSFKVSVPANLVETFKNPNIWPEYVGIDRYQNRFLQQRPSPQEHPK